MNTRRSWLLWIPVFALVLVALAQSPQCPVCKEHKWESKIYPGLGSSTAIYCQPFYDEKGRYHSHSCNESRYEYRCSRGHEWVVIDRGPACPYGDYPRDPPHTYVTKGEPEKK